MHLIANKTWMAVDEMDPPLKAVLKVDLMALGHWDTIGHNDHHRELYPPGDA